MDSKHLDMKALTYRDEVGMEFTQVTAQCKCGRGGWLRIPTVFTDPDISKDYQTISEIDKDGKLWLGRRYETFAKAGKCGGLDVHS